MDEMKFVIFLCNYDKIEGFNILSKVLKIVAKNVNISND